VVHPVNRREKQEAAGDAPERFFPLLPGLYTPVGRTGQGDEGVTCRTSHLAPPGFDLIQRNGVPHRMSNLTHLFSACEAIASSDKGKFRLVE
jgi:hypothetical protein